MIRTKLFLILLALIIPIGPRYHESKKEVVKFNKYEETLIPDVTKGYRVLNYSPIELPEAPVEPEITTREKVEELIAKGKYVITGYCSCQKCKGSFGGKKAKGLPPDIEIEESDTIPGLIGLGRYVMMDGVRYKTMEDGSLKEYPDINKYCGDFVECNCKKCNGTHDLFLVRK